MRVNFRIFAVSRSLIQTYIAFCVAKQLNRVIHFGYGVCYRTNRFPNEHISVIIVPKL